MHEIYVQQLAYYQGFLEAEAYVSTPITMHGVGAYTAALNDTIREIKRTQGIPVQTEQRVLPWLAQTTDPGTV